MAQLRHNSGALSQDLSGSPVVGRISAASAMTVVKNRLWTRLRANAGPPGVVPAQRVETALGHAVAGLVATIVVLQAGIAELEAAMTAEFDAHPDAVLLGPVPGLGPVLAARVLGEIGEDRARFPGAENLRAFAGTAPITKASGRRRRLGAEVPVGLERDHDDEGRMQRAVKLPFRWSMYAARASLPAAPSPAWSTFPFPTCGRRSQRLIRRDRCS